MSSTFVTRLKVGEILVDAKGVSRLVSRQVGLWPLSLFAAAGLGAVVVAIVASPRPAALDRPAQPADPGPPRPRVASSHRADATPPARSCSRRPRTSGRFLAEPHHLVRLVAGHRRRHTRPARPRARRRAGSCTRRCGRRSCAGRPRSRRCMVHRASSRRSRVAWYMTAERLDVELTLEPTPATDHTNVELTVERAVHGRPAPLASPAGAQPALRPVPDCRRALRCSTSATTSPRSRPSSSR